MWDKEWLEALEYKVSVILGSIADENLRGFWCDGVVFTEPEKYYSPKYVHESRQMKFQCFSGKDGQTAYSLTLYLGNKALSRFDRDLSILDCIPQTDLENWFQIDLVEKKMDLHLD